MPDKRSDYEVIGEMDALLREASNHLRNIAYFDREAESKMRVSLVRRIDRALLTEAERQERRER